MSLGNEVGRYKLRLLILNLEVALGLNLSHHFDVAGTTVGIHLHHLFHCAVLRAHIVDAGQTVLLLDTQLVEDNVVLIIGGEGHKLLILAHTVGAGALDSILLTMLNYMVIDLLILTLQILIIYHLSTKIVAIHRWIRV